MSQVGIRISRRRVVDGGAQEIGTAVTNSDGRCDSPLLEGDAMQPGVYELVFEAGAYFDAAGVQTETPRFLDDVILRFGIADASQHYHVPLLISPYGYTTYRGS